MDDRLLTAVPQTEDQLEENLRPRSLDEYIGQTVVKDNLRVFIQAALNRNEPLDHALFYGPPGIGKTTLAHIISQEMDAQMHSTSGPVIERAGDLAAMLTNLEPGDVLFIDEIHRLSPHVEEILYPALEDRQLDILVGQGPAARTIKIDLPPFTLVGATTRTGMLTNPLRDRFGVLLRLNFYNHDELHEIIIRAAKVLNIRIENDGAAEIAKRSRGTPRIANRLLRRVRDFAEVEHQGVITAFCAGQALERLEVDAHGLDAMDQRLLITIIEKFDGGPVGLETLSAALSEEKDTIEDVLEPYLLQEGFIARTPKGRVATPIAYAHFGFADKNESTQQGKLI